jgi:hypothetical protein
MCVCLLVCAFVLVCLLKYVCLLLECVGNRASVPMLGLGFVGPLRRLRCFSGIFVGLQNLAWQRATPLCCPALAFPFWTSS